MFRHMTIVLAGLLLGFPALAGSEEDRRECAANQSQDDRIAACSRVLDDQSANPGLRTMAYRNRGIAYTGKKLFELAVFDLDEALRLSPQDQSSLANRGWALSQMGQPDRAIADYTEVIRLAPKFAPAYNNRGNAWYNKEDYDRAIADYTEAIRLDPNNADRHEARGFAYFYQANFTASAADMLRAIELKDDIYHMLFRYLARSRAGQNASAELEANSGRLKEKVWPYAVIELYLDRRSPAATLDAAANPGDRCEAEFYIGEWHLIRNEREQARPRLQAAADACPKGFVEYIAAVAELKRLKP